MALIQAPIDNKNLMEDNFEDDDFEDFYVAHDHRERGKRHLVGIKDVEQDGIICESGLVDVTWKHGGNCVTITLLAIPRTEDWEYTRKKIFADYQREFASWQCEENEGLVVKFHQFLNTLEVQFYFKIND